MEDKRTPEEIKAKRDALEKRKTAHRRSGSVRRLLQIATLTTVGLFAKSTGAEAQGFHYERVNTTQTQAHQQPVYGTVEWAISQGYEVDPYLSIGLNHYGIRGRDGYMEHRGYKAACIKRNYQNPDASEVLFIPNFPEDARSEDCQTLATALQWKRQPNNTRDYSNPYKRPNKGIRSILPRGWLLE